MTREEQLSKYIFVENNSKKYPNGMILKNNEGLLYKILGKSNRETSTKTSTRYFVCEFENGYITEVNEARLRDGKIKNLLHPSVAGVGFMGIGKWKSRNNYKETKEYNIWKDIINRCYNENDTGYKNYGAKGVTVDESWHNFQNFCEDIQNLKNYDKWKKGEDYHLDKDIICQKEGIIPKIYSKDTCMFISKHDNISEATSRKNLTGLTYIATSPNGEEYEIFNYSKFAKEHCLTPSSVCNCIKGRQESTKGWKFRIKNA